MWDQTPAVYIDIPGWPEFPAKPHLTVSSQAEVFPQFGNTKCESWLDPIHSLHTYVAEAGEKIGVSIDAGNCTWDVCSRCDGHPLLVRGRVGALSTCGSRYSTRT